MQYYMFGLDEARPAQCALELRRKGFRAAFASSPAAISALAENGLDAYGCVGAFHLPGRPATDLWGEKRTWFGSGCPRDEEMLSRNLREAEALARTEGLKGIFTDGARFASPQAGEAFFTCFCGECRRAGERIGADMEALGEGIAAFRRGGPLPEDFYRLREHGVARYMRRFVEAVKGANPSLIAGAFVFPGTLARLVGQTDAALAPLDVLSPMLYRKYPDAEGPACLNHEYAALWRLAGRRPEGLEDCAAASPDELLAEGFPPERLGREMGFQKPMAPVLQLDDSALADSVRAARRGARAVGFFAYGRADAPDVRAFEESNA